MLNIAIHGTTSLRFGAISHFEETPGCRAFWTRTLFATDDSERTFAIPFYSNVGAEALMTTDEKNEAILRDADFQAHEAAEVDHFA